MDQRRRELLDTLHRLRDQEKRAATLVFAEAEQERRAAEAQVDTTDVEILETHSPDEDPAVVAERHAWRERLRERRAEELAIVEAKEGVSEERKLALGAALKQAKVMERLLETERELGRVEDIRKGDRVADEVTSARWHRK